MQLSNLIAHVEGADLIDAHLNGTNRNITGIALDSRNVKEGFLFIAVRGTEHNGQGFIPSALKKGAIAIMTTDEIKPDDLPENIALITVQNIRLALSQVAASFYPRMPSQIAAVTGTSGKTSTVQFVRQLWELANRKAASLGTLGLIAPDVERYGELTTPDPITLHKILRETVDLGVTHLAMEASSHGIELNRLDSVPISVAAFTNFSRDHLDYHKTMDKYLEAKLHLFTDLLQHDGTAVLNADIPEYKTLKQACDKRKLKTISFGMNGNELKVHHITPDTKGQRLQFNYLGKEYDIMLPLIGSFQAVNSICALAITIASGEDPEQSIFNLEKLDGVPGRLEFIGSTASGGHVFVDYAHKPAALENVLLAMRPHVSAHDGAQLHVIFGCGGNRDKGKRPLMGEISTRLADQIIVTDDNPRNEDSDLIRKEIVEGCQTGPNLREIGERRQAISEGIKALNAHDVLVIAGKGHEEGQIVGNKVLPFHDATCAKEFLGDPK